MQIPQGAQNFTCYSCKSISSRIPTNQCLFVCGTCHTKVLYSPLSQYIRCTCGTVNFLPYHYPATPPTGIPQNLAVNMVNFVNTGGIQNMQANQNNATAQQQGQNRQGQTNQQSNNNQNNKKENAKDINCLLYTSPSPRDRQKSRMPSSA
eukprot:TRINITY_DN12678_c0_g1_i1.p4 TRINITY_DN12678_c0_g1~~TRINITY_DN12678_c0_g1_i1.p4  ORF type:complete len:150 (+),score=10.34 TRINITY_DN12678_c0_g1_i1:136-585(+)